MNEQEVREMMEAMDQKKAEMEGGSRKFWSPPSKKEGTFTIRILPPLKKNGEKLFFFTHRSHWLNGTSYDCLNQTLVDKNGVEHPAEVCPVCQFTKKLFNTSERNSDEWNLASSISAKPRYIFRIVVRGHENETTPVFFETGKTIFEIIYHVIRETDYGVIVDPKNGRDFNIVKVGVGRRSRYEQSLPAATVSPIFKDMEKVKECFEKAMLLDYNSLIEFVSADYLEGQLKEHLGVTPSSEKPKVASIRKETHVEEIDDNEESAEDSDEEDSIDSIINEFVS